MSKKKVKMIVLICVISVMVAAVVYASKNMDFFHWGEENADIKAAVLGGAVARVNGVDIPESKFHSYKLGLANASGKFSDEEILQKLIRQEVIMQEIDRLGYTVTEEEVTKFNDERFAFLKEDPNAYQMIKNYVDGLGITMEEYKERSREISKIALLTNKYREDIMKEYEKNNTAESADSAQQKAQKVEMYFKEKIEMLMNAATIEIIK